MTEWLWKSVARWLIIAAPIVIAKLFGLFKGSLSQPTYIALGLIAAFVVILTATFAEIRWGCKHASESKDYVALGRSRTDSRSSTLAKLARKQRAEVETLSS